LDHRFETITQEQCAALELDFVILLDKNFEPRQDCCKVEQACQLEIDNLDLGTQRLHRVAGAGKPHLFRDGGCMIVGATIFPPDFFKNNPNIVIVASFLSST
jgi:hypothetical protein